MVVDLSYLANITPLKILQCLCIAMYDGNSCAHTLKHFRAHTPTFFEALVEVVSVSMCSFMSLVVI